MTEPRGRSGYSEAEEEGGRIESDPSNSSEKKSRQENDWMNGRAVFIRPEGRPSNAAKRDIVLTDQERRDIERAHREASLARAALTPDELQAEIAEFREQERTQRRTSILFASSANHQLYGRTSLSASTLIDGKREMSTQGGIAGRSEILGYLSRSRDSRLPTSAARRPSKGSHSTVKETSRTGGCVNRTFDIASPLSS